MNPDLEVDLDELRRTATAMADTAARLIDGSSPGVATDLTPRWATTDAASLAAETARRQLSGLGAQIAETARQITLAADEYELADARAATRLRLAR